MGDVSPFESFLSIFFLMCCPFRMVNDFEDVGFGSSADTRGIAMGAIGFGMDSLQMTFVSETSEFITGPGTGFRKLSFTVTCVFHINNGTL